MGKKLQKHERQMFPLCTNNVCQHDSQHALIFSIHFHHIFPPSQVLYFSSLFPYVVLLCFLVRALLLEGAADGIRIMFTPKVRDSCFGLHPDFEVSVVLNLHS